MRKGRGGGEKRRGWGRKEVGEEGGRRGKG